MSNQWPLRYETVLSAMNIVSGSRPLPSDCPVTRELVRVLLTHEVRGEFDGTLASAKKCLETTGYLIGFKVSEGDKL